MDRVARRGPLARAPGALKRKKLRKKVSQCQKKLKGGTLWDFSTSIQSQNSKKIEGGTLWEIFFRKNVSQCRKKLKGVLSGMVCYAGKQEKPFWFSSLGQMVHIGSIIIYRIFNNYFGQFVWIEKKKKSHYNSRVSLHEAPSKNNEAHSAPNKT